MFVFFLVISEVRDLSLEINFLERDAVVIIIDVRCRAAVDSDYTGMS